MLAIHLRVIELKSLPVHQLPVQFLRASPTTSCAVKTWITVPSPWAFQRDAAQLLLTPLSQRVYCPTLLEYGTH
jgi:hypothetical protein